MNRGSLAFFVGVVFSLNAVVVEATDGCRLQVGWEPYAPYTFADEEDRATGVDIDLIKAIGAEIGCSLAFVELPWARILREVENGTLDVSTSTSWTLERTAWALFSEPYRETEMAIYVRRGELSRFDLSSLVDIPRARLRLGVNLDYFYGDEFAALMQDPDYAKWIDPGTDYPINIRKLIMGRIDGYLAEDVAVMETELRRLGRAEQVERYPLPITGEKLRFMFSRRTVDPRIVAEVDTVVAQMRADGRLQAILRKYLR